MRKVPITLLVLLFVASGSVMAQTTQVIELTSTKDSQLIEGFGGGTNKGNGGMFYWENTDTVLYQWDVSGVTLPPPDKRMSVELELFSCDIGGYQWNYQITAFPMRDAWQEGVGIPTDGYGGKGFPWGPTSVGDATFAHKSVSTVGPGVAPFDVETVGLTGTAWETPGALGTTTDCYDRKMMDYLTIGPQGPYPEGDSYGRWPFTAEGITVVEEWITGSLTNNGLVLAHENMNPDPLTYCNLRPAARERTSVVPGTQGPTLVITIGPHFGDANEDGCVDGLDYVAWSNNYETGTTWGQGDFKDDDFVDGLDYVIWSNNYNAGVCPPPGVVPEPATMALLAIGGLAALLKRRR